MSSCTFSVEILDLYFNCEYKISIWALYKVCKAEINDLQYTNRKCVENTKSKYKYNIRLLSSTRLVLVNRIQRIP